MKPNKPTRLDPSTPRCVYDAADKKQNHIPDRALFTGKRLNKRFVDSIFQNYSSTKLYIVTVIHIVGVQSPNSNATIPVIDQGWIDTVLGIANRIWSQACIEIVPYYPGNLITTFKDLGLSPGLGECIVSSQRYLIEPYEVRVPETKIINVYLVEDTTGDACGSPVYGEIFMPTTFSAEVMGRVFAHELGHLLLNPVGVDDSDNPDHLMFHSYRHPDIPVGKNNGLFLSDCLGARAIAMEDYFAHNRPGGFNFGSTSEPIRCTLNPALGPNLEIVMVDENMA